MITTLAVTNFRGVETYELTNIQGDVKVRGRNAIGKTSIFLEAIAWCFTGKDSMGKTASVRPVGSNKPTEVSVTFNNETFTRVMTYQGLNTSTKLFINNNEVGKGEFEYRAPKDWALLTNPLAHQGVHWSDLRALVMLAATNTHVDGYEAVTSLLSPRSKDPISDLRKELRSKVREYTDKTKTIPALIKELQTSGDPQGLEKELEELESSEEAWNAEQADLKKVIQELRETVRARELDEADANKRYVEHKAKLDSIIKAREKGVCETCGQPWHGDADTTELEALVKDARDYRQHLVELTNISRGRLDALTDRLAGFARGSNERTAAVVRTELQALLKNSNRLNELREELKQASFEAEKHEGLLIELDAYETALVKAAEGSINEFFAPLRINVFEPLANGGFKEACTVTDSNGVPFAALNQGAKPILGAEFIVKLQELKGVNYPIFLDGMSEVTTEVPSFGRQVFNIGAADSDLEVTM